MSPLFLGLGWSFKFQFFSIHAICYITKITFSTLNETCLEFHIELNHH
jgi:hypothetical protein